MLNEEKRNTAKEVFKEQVKTYLERNYISSNCIQVVYTLENFFETYKVKTETGKELFILFQKNINTNHTNIFLQIKKITNK